MSPLSLWATGPTVGEIIHTLFQLAIIFALSLCLGIWPECLQKLVPEALRSEGDADAEQRPPPSSAPSPWPRTVGPRPAPPPSPSSALAQGVVRLPSMAAGELAQMLRLTEFAALAGTQHSMQASLWDSANVWSICAASRSIPCVASAPDGFEARGRFRRFLYRLDGHRLRELSTSAHGQVLCEATRMLFGFLLEDFEGEAAAECEDTIEFLFSRTEVVLSDLDPESTTLVQLANKFLKAVRKSIVLLGEIKVERLEYAYKSARELHNMMVSAMKKDLSRQINEVECFFEDVAPQKVKPKRSNYNIMLGPGPLERRRQKREKEMGRDFVANTASTSSAASTRSPTSSFSQAA